MKKTKDEQGLMIELGELCVGYSRNAFNWIAQLSRYERTRFFGFSYKRVFFGLLISSGNEGAQTVRARVEHMTNQVKRDIQYLEELEEKGNQSD